MHSYEDQTELPASTAELSKRGARRLIQRALVLTERDRNVRRRVRETQVITLWVLADWDLAWTVAIDHGHIEFERRTAKKPELVLTWKAAEDFFRQATTSELSDESFEREGDLAVWRSASPVVRAFFRKLDSVLRHPVDENGVRLV
jgi:hypothetical protein